MADIKRLGLISPFALVPSASVAQRQPNKTPRQAPRCNCDSDEENDFGMAPECAFVCKHTSKKNTSKKRRSNAHAAKKTRHRTMH